MSQPKNTHHKSTPAPPHQESKHEHTTAPTKPWEASKPRKETEPDVQGSDREHRRSQGVNASRHRSSRPSPAAPGFNSASHDCSFEPSKRAAKPEAAAPDPKPSPSTKPKSDVELLREAKLELERTEKLVVYLRALVCMLKAKIDLV